MKKFIISAFVLCSFLAVTTPGMADLEEYKTNIKDGVKTIANSPKPLVNTVRDEFNASTFKPFGIIGGTLKGSLHSLKELGKGVFQVVTFNVWEDNFVSKYFDKEKSE